MTIRGPIVALFIFQRLNIFAAQILGEKKGVYALDGSNSDKQKAHFKITALIKVSKPLQADCACTNGNITYAQGPSFVEFLSAQNISWFNQTQLRD